MGFDGRKVALHSRYPYPHGGINGDVKISNHNFIVLQFIDGGGRDYFHLEDIIAVLGVLFIGHSHESNLGVKLHLLVLIHLVNNSKYIVIKILNSFSGSAKLILPEWVSISSGINQVAIYFHSQKRLYLSPTPLFRLSASYSLPKFLWFCLRSVTFHFHERPYHCSFSQRFIRFAFSFINFRLQGCRFHCLYLSSCLAVFQ